MKPKITLSMIVKNEEKYLRGCLDSAKNAVDEIVIVDTGSSDLTLDIAKEYDAKIFHFKWINDFSAARNYALSKSIGEWILYLDADERLTHDSIEELRQITRHNEHFGVKCIVESLSDNYTASQSMKYTRLFKNNKLICFSGKVHEQIDPSLIKNNYKLIDSYIKIIHEGYNITTEELKAKAARNLNLLLVEYKLSKSAYISYQIANSLSILDDYSSAILYYKKSIEHSDLNKDLKIVCYQQLADYYMRKNGLTIAKEYVHKGLQINSDNPILNMIASQIYAKLNDVKAIKYCKNAFYHSSSSKNNFNEDSIQKLSVDEKKIILEGILLSLKFNDGQNLAYFKKELKKLNKIEGKLLEELLNNSPSSLDINNLLDIVNDNNMNFYQQVIDSLNNVEVRFEIYSKLFEKFNNNSKFLNSFGSFLLSSNKLQEAKTIFEYALQNKDFEDTSVFYLASIYINLNESYSLNKLCAIIDQKIDENSINKQKFALLREKIKPILNL